MSTPPPILIFSEDRDPVTRRAAIELAERSGHPVEVCGATDLARAAYFFEARCPNGAGGAAAQPAASHGILTRDIAQPGEIVLRDGRLLLQDRLQGVWNRLEAWPSSVAGREAGAADCIAAWIAGARCALLGEPGISTPQLTGSWTRQHWTHAAVRAGLPVPPVIRAGNGCLPPPGERVAVLVAGEQHCVTGPLADELGPEILQACVRLARIAGRFLEVRLVPEGQSGWRFAEADPNPDPFPHGQPGIASLAAFFAPALSPQDGRVLPAPLASLEDVG